MAPTASEFRAQAQAKAAAMKANERGGCGRIIRLVGRHVAEAAHGVAHGIEQGTRAPWK